MKLLLINSTVNTGSTGRIVEEIGQTALSFGNDSWIAYGRIARRSHSQLIRIGNDWDIKMHGLQTRLFDNHCFASVKATKQFIKKIEEIKPDIINLHNLHGYYINIEILFNYLKTKDIPIVWTLHDSWSFTGHCAYFDRYDCTKWQTQCKRCPNIKAYPSSLFIDSSKSNFVKKKSIFTQINNMTFVTPSVWLKDILKQSFFRNYPVHIINNGIDLKIFCPGNENTYKKYNFGETKIILGVANTWSQGKGFFDFINLSKLLDNDYKVVLAGLNHKQIALLPENIIGIEQTENVYQLAELYSIADVFINPTYLDNFPTVNLEALACGTPVITYNTGGSPEIMDEQTGLVVEKGNISELYQAILKLLTKDKEFYKDSCRKRAENFFDKNERYKDYIDLFDSLLKAKKH